MGMKKSEACYAAAQYFSEHGFSPQLNPHGHPTCFVGAANIVASTTGECGCLGCLGGNIGIEIPTGEMTLEREGWTTNDAIAAAQMVGDCYAANGE